MYYKIFVLLFVCRFVTGAILEYVPFVRCWKYECCTDEWISNDFTSELSKTLESRLFGQHLVTLTVFKLLAAWSRNTPSKALTLSFHGPSGTGKSYVSQLIVEAMFRKGMESKYVHLITAPKDFLDEEKVPMYKEMLKDIIESAVAKCERSLFIIDELHLMPTGLIDVLKPYVDFHDNIGGRDYRKVIFLFLSKTAGDSITQHTLDHWESSKTREEITLKEMEKIIRTRALNEDNGLWHSEMITDNLISAFIPFMPLERRHLEQCIRAALTSYYSKEEEDIHVSRVMVKEIADELEYYPENIEVFSSSGCKKLSKTLESHLYGQHLVTSPVLKLLKAHSRDNPSKALTFSFHGWTGTGKNYVSKLIVEAMFKMGMKSKYVHLISATKEFPHEEMVSLYKDKLRDMIETGVSECERSVFIIDEMDKMPKGLIDTLKPYLDFYETIGGIDYRKTVFIFLSNTAGNDIARHTIDHWKSSKPREDVTLKEMEKVIRLPALNSENGLWHSDLITKNLISAYIPFMPLERSHVKQCIRAGLISKGYYSNEAEIHEVKVQEIADELQYYPDNILIFSTTGCKRIHEKIDYIMEEL